MEFKMDKDKEVWREMAAAALNGVLIAAGKDYMPGDAASDAAKIADKMLEEYNKRANPRRFGE